jgi:hypothetical protein
MESRSFTIDKILKSDGSKVQFKGGRYIGVAPGQVVKKMFSHAYKHCRIKCNSMKIYLHETTQNSLKKEYSYRVTRKACGNDCPTIERDGELITFKFTTKVKSI